MEILTVGHSVSPLDDLLARVKRHHVEVLVDVRTAPYSGRAPQFNRENLQAVLNDAGIKYLFLGRELGGRPPADLRDSTGRADYDAMAGTELFRAGVDRLLKGASKFRVALLCSEGRFDACHRWLLVGRALERDHGARIRHILPDGSIWEEPPPLVEGPLGLSKNPVPAA